MTVVNIDCFPAELIRLLAVAKAELDRHVNSDGRCAVCGVAFPCERACLAERALGAFYGRVP